MNIPSDFLGPHTALIVFGVMSLLCLSQCAVAIRGVWRGLRSLGWPNTSGVVLADDLDVGSNGRVPTFRAKIVYRYQVGEREFTGSRIFWGDQTRFPFKGGAERRVGVYKTGTDVRVFYDPANPERSVLEPGVDWLAWYFLAVAVILTGAIVYFWYSYDHQG